MKILHKTNLFLRSLLFSILLIVITIIYSFFSLASFILPLRFRCAMISAWTKSMIWLLKVICRIDYRIEGVENIPKNRNGIILSKHQSTWETFFLQGYFTGTTIILKKELLWVPFFGWGLATIDPIAIKRSSKATAMEQILKKGKQSLEDGRWVLVFPEGTRMAPGTIGNYKLGGARLASYTGHPVLPIAHNAGRYWSKRSFIKKPGTVHVVIGPLIETKDRTPEAILSEAKNWIESTMTRIDHK